MANNAQATKVELSPSENLRLAKEAASNRIRSSLISLDDEKTHPNGRDHLVNQPEYNSQPGAPEEDLPPEGDVDWKKRHDDGRRYQTQLTDTVKQQADKIAELEAEKLIKEKTSLPRTEAELVAWKESNPEMYDTMLTLIRMETNDLTKEYNSLQKKTKHEVVFQEVLKAHPDAGQIRQSEDFLNWFQAQPRGIQSLIESTLSSEIIRGIDMYKSDTSKGVQQPSVPNKDIDSSLMVTTKGSTTPPTNQGQVWSREQIKNMSDQDYGKYREEIKKAMNEGRIV